MHTKGLYILITLFLLIQIPSLFSTYPADEHIYYYMGKVVAEGARPYIDFRHAHPPLQVYLYALIIKLFGLHIWLLKLITLLFNIGTAIIMYFFVRERWNKKAAFYSLFIFLTSYLIFVHGTYSYGTEIALFFFMLSLWYLNRNPLLCGLFYSLMAMSRLHFAVLGVILFFYVKDKKKFLLGLTPLVGYYLLLSSVPNFISNVFMFHVAKPLMKEHMLKFFMMQSYMVVLFFMSLRYRKNNLILWLVFAQLLFFLLLKVVFAYYFLILVLLFSITGGIIAFKSKYRLHILTFVITYFLMINLPIYTNTITSFPTLNEVITKLNTYDGALVGITGITPLLALKSGKEIKNLQIDTNIAYEMPYNYSDSIVVDRNDRFHIPTCEKLFVIADSTLDHTYGVWKCP